MVKIKSESGTTMPSNQKLEAFISKIPKFDDLGASRKIDFFIYFLTFENGASGTDIASIKNCFKELKITPYSNISAYLGNNSKKGRGLKPKFISDNGLFHLERMHKAELEKLIGVPPSVPATSNYFPLSIFDNTRTHLVKIAIQACKSYDNEIFDGCAVLTRKLLEILIIETFERYGIEDRIKDKNGYFYYLSDLIDRLLSESKWTIGRNAKQAIPSLKKMGDQSAHNRRYFAQRSDIEKIKDDLRVVLDELVHLIDYPTWNKELATAKI